MPVLCIVSFLDGKVVAVADISSSIIINSSWIDTIGMVPGTGSNMNKMVCLTLTSKRKE